LIAPLSENGRNTATRSIGDKSTSLRKRAFDPNRSIRHISPLFPVTPGGAPREVRVAMAHNYQPSKSDALLGVRVNSIRRVGNGTMTPEVLRAPFDLESLLVAARELRSIYKACRGRHTGDRSVAGRTEEGTTHPVFIDEEALPIERSARPLPHERDGA